MFQKKFYRKEPKKNIDVDALYDIVEAPSLVYVNMYQSQLNRLGCFRGIAQETYDSDVKIDASDYEQYLEQVYKKATAFKRQKELSEGQASH